MMVFWILVIVVGGLVALCLAMGLLAAFIGAGGHALNIEDRERQPPGHRR